MFIASLCLSRLSLPPSRHSISIASSLGNTRGARGVVSGNVGTLVSLLDHLSVQDLGVRCIVWNVSWAIWFISWNQNIGGSSPLYFSRLPLPLSMSQFCIQISDRLFIARGLSLGTTFVISVSVAATASMLSVRFQRSWYLAGACVVSVFFQGRMCIFAVAFDSA